MKKTLTKLLKATPAAASVFLMSAQLAMVSADNTIANIDPGSGFATNIGTVINFVLRVVMVISILLVFFYLILGGIEWITSGGEKGKTEAARNKITSAIIGLIVLAASYAILTLLLQFLGFGGNLNTAIDSVGTIRAPKQ
jgi:hypothetical protein